MTRNLRARLKKAAGFLDALTAMTCRSGNVSVVVGVCVVVDGLGVVCVMVDVVICVDVGVEDDGIVGAWDDGGCGGFCDCECDDDAVAAGFLSISCS